MWIGPRETVLVILADIRKFVSVHLVDAINSGLDNGNGEVLSIANQNRPQLTLSFLLPGLAYEACPFLYCLTNSGLKG